MELTATNPPNQGLAFLSSLGSRRQSQIDYFVCLFVKIKYWSTLQTWIVKSHHLNPQKTLAILIGVSEDEDFNRIGRAEKNVGDFAALPAGQESVADQFMLFSKKSYDAEQK